VSHTCNRIEPGMALVKLLSTCTAPQVTESHVGANGDVMHAGSARFPAPELSRSQLRIADAGRNLDPGNCAQTAR
jgi:hypothetical protein